MLVTSSPLWLYLAIACVDLQANFMVLSAFRYANFATIALLLHFTIPFVTLLSYVFLGTRYCWKHYIGVAIALTGSVILSASDYQESNNNDELKGDVIAIVSAFLYATANVTQEFCIGQNGVRGLLRDYEDV